MPKLLATRGYGADVVLEGATVETPLRLAAEFAERTGAVLIHPFDHRDIIIGQGTLGLELLDDGARRRHRHRSAIGGGGLIAGVAAAVKARAAAAGRTVRIIGVQAENSAAYPSSLAAGASARGRDHARRSPTASPSRARATSRSRSSASSSTRS